MTHPRPSPPQERGRLCARCDSAAVEWDESLCRDCAAEIEAEEEEREVERERAQEDRARRGR